MAGLTIGTDKTNARIFIVSIILLGFTLLNLIPISFGRFGGIWPIAPIWAIGAWANLGARVKLAAVLFIIGITMDVISATNIGAFASINVLTYGAYLFILRFIGNSAIPSVIDGAIIGAIYIVVCFFVGIFVRQWPNILALLIPIAITILLYPRMARYFTIAEPAK